MNRDEIFEEIENSSHEDKIWLLGVLQQRIHDNGQDIPLHKSTWKKLCKDCQQRLRGEEEPEDAVSVILPRSDWEKVMEEIDNGQLKKIIEHQLMDVTQ